MYRHVAEDHALSNTPILLRARIPREQVERNLDGSLARGLPSAFNLSPGRYAAVCGGGPSLALYHGERPCVALNGAVQRVAADYAITFDPSPQNAAWYADALPTTKYLVGSRADPSVFDALRNRHVSIWHVNDTPEAERGLLPMVGFGSSVGIRSICLLYALGVRWFDIYGMDSCVVDGSHHAYPQAWNDTDDVLTWTIDGREFQGSPWHMQQVHDFDRMLTMMPDARFRSHGDGAITWLLQRLRDKGIASCDDVAPGVETEALAGVDS
jgi:hypothetical protein